MSCDFPAIQKSRTYFWKQIQTDRTSCVLWFVGYQRWNGKLNVNHIIVSTQNCPIQLKILGAVCVEWFFSQWAIFFASKLWYNLVYYKRLHKIFSLRLFCVDFFFVGIFKASANYIRFFICEVWKRAPQIVIKIMLAEN